MINATPEDSLRLRRQQSWARFAQLAQNNSAPPQEICQGWSLEADQLLSQAFHFCFENQKVALFSLGKLGSQELNLSSDVDVLLVALDEDNISLSSLRKFQKMLTERTSQGFVFRVDFDLRPGGKQGPLIPTLDQFKDYYGNYGETWERLAFVRLRPLCGDLFVQQEVMAFAKKFSFRRHLDFTVLEDLKTLRTKIQGHYWISPEENVIDLKLGVGGIRDVELFAHALQVIHGGRETLLQIRGTTEALDLLREKNLLPSEESLFLQKHYWNLRCLENYVQALHDEQTHLLNLNDSHPDFVTEALKTLANEMVRCDQIVKTLLGEAPQAVSLEGELKKMGLPEQDLEDLWQEILGQKVLSRNKIRDEVARKAFLASFLENLQAQQGNVRRGLLLLKDFIRSTRAKASFFSLLLREKELLKELTWLFGHSPYLSQILCSRPELLDSFVYRSQDKHSPDLGTLLEELAEKKLLSEIISGSEFLEDKDLTSLMKNLSSTADSIVKTLLDSLRAEFPSALQILALGKWGGQELGFRSDLDFIFVVPNEGSENDFKVAKRLISRLTEPHRGGNIYSVDMRLRPSGKAGPLVISEKDLRHYLKVEASAWERQAYLKARWLKSDVSLVTDYIDRGLTAEDLNELDRIRQQLLAPSGNINLKYSEGGLVDVELAVQTALLSQKTIPSSSQTRDFFAVWGPQGLELRHNYERLRQVEQTLQLVASESLVELKPNHESFQDLALALHASPAKLLEEIQELLKQNRAILKELDPRRQPH